MQSKSHVLGLAENQHFIKGDKTLVERAQNENQMNCMNLFSTEDPNSGVTIYSVDSMHAYVNIFKPKVQNSEINREQLKSILSQKVWIYKDKFKKDQHISPLEVLNNPNIKELKRHVDSIRLANINYPIYVRDSNKTEVIDGFHRLAKIYRDVLKNSNSVELFFYSFSDELLKKFIFMNKINPNIPVTGTFETVIEDFYNKFCREKIKKSKK